MNKITKGREGNSTKKIPKLNVYVPECLKQFNFRIPGIALGYLIIFYEGSRVYAVLTVKVPGKI